jgi:hypothetical protein
MTDASVASLLGEHPGAVAMLAVVAIAALVLGALAWTMARAGVSRPCSDGRRSAE